MPSTALDAPARPKPEAHHGCGAEIHNPVLPGFNPDPSLIRLEDDYYMAVSTFQWLPGVSLYHSRDLAHWRLASNALTRPDQINMLGVPDSGGVWAPSLTHHQGRFYLMYSNVRTSGGPFKDVTNWLISAPSIDGPWSDPLFLNSTGFDASLFHDDNGCSWVVQIQWDYRRDRHRFGGIVLQQLDLASGSGIGEPVTIYHKPGEVVEGPNLYHRDGWYYLMLAEGGTAWRHAVTMARSRSITGPYETDPQPWVLSSRDQPHAILQKAGHGELVETQHGEWYLAHLASRTAWPERRSIRGRETSLQRVVWNADGWLRLDGGGSTPRDTWPAPLGLTAQPWPGEAQRDDFDAPTLAPYWMSPRLLLGEPWASTTERPGWLRLRGRESINSLHQQTMAVRRLVDLPCTLSATMEFRPRHFTQMAGLVVVYQSNQYAYLRVTIDDQLGMAASVATCDRGDYQEPHPRIPVANWSQVHLRAVITELAIRFAVSPDGRTWTPVGPEIDTSRMSEDFAGGFTGTMLGVCAQDLRGGRAHADFDHVTLQPGHP